MKTQEQFKSDVLNYELYDIDLSERVHGKIIDRIYNEISEMTEKQRTQHIYDRFCMTSLQASLFLEKHDKEHDKIWDYEKHGQMTPDEFADMSCTEYPDYAIAGLRYGKAKNESDVYEVLYHLHEYIKTHLDENII